MHKPTLAIRYDHALTDRLTRLEKSLACPFCSMDGETLPDCAEFDFYLRYEQQGESLVRLELVRPDGELGKGFCIDFSSGNLAHRRQFGGGRGQTLARAIGLKGGANPRVVDATAGIGRDAFVLACLGVEITLIERSPVLAILLQDALQRAAHDPALVEIIARMKLVQGNAIEWLQQCPPEQRPDVVYLDPMYPQRNKSALVKKEMRILRTLVGEDEDADQLLHAALGCARQKVVVKRPRTAPEISGKVLAGLRPASSLESKNTRYDIYPAVNSHQ